MNLRELFPGLKPKHLLSSIFVFMMVLSGPAFSQVSDFPTMPGMSRVRCIGGQWILLQPGVHWCRCPSGLRPIVREEGHLIYQVCQGSAVRAQPVHRRRPSVFLPAPGSAERACMTGREMFHFLNQHVIYGETLRTKSIWLAGFQKNGIVKFNYSGGGRELNYWSVVGFAILLRKSPRGRVIARRRICWDARGRKYWADYATYRRKSLITDRSVLGVDEDIFADYPLEE